jgi:hypothetical protein
MKGANTAPRNIVHQAKTTKSNTSASSLKWMPPLFLPPTNYAAGGVPTSVAISDINGDGKPDILVAACPEDCGFSAEGTVSVLLGKGDGTFSDPVNYGSGGRSPISIAVADVNGDGKRDILVANGDSSSIGVLLGNGDGTFQTAVPWNPPVGSTAISEIEIADVNRDGKPDVLILSGFSVGVALGNGDGTFHWSGSYGDQIAFLTSSFAVADVNGDGKLDLEVVYWNGNVVGVLLGNGDGTFQSETLYDSGGIHPDSIAVADLNGDGHLDLVVGNNCGSNCGSNGTASVLLGNGDGTFRTPVNYGWGEFFAVSVAISDVNRDGKLDVVLGTDCLDECGQGPNGIGVLRGNGDGTFQPLVSYSPDTIGRAQLFVADLNGDGRPDVVDLPQSGLVPDFGVALHVGITATTTAVTSSLNPSVYGQAVPLNATVSSSSIPTGTVEFFDSSSDSGGATLANGSGSLDVQLGAGSHSIIAAYQGSLKLRASASAPMNQVVNIATTTTSAVRPSLNPNPPGKVLNYSATVTGQYGGGAGGTVTFFDGGTPFGTASLLNGKAIYSISYPSFGVHSITATYSGDANNYGSTSAKALTEYIEYLTITKLSTSGSPSMFGQPVTFTATVTSQYGAIPDGELVTFYDGSKVLSSVPLAGGKVTYTTSSLAVGTHSIIAKYGGDGRFHPSARAVAQKVTT